MADKEKDKPKIPSLKGGKIPTLKGSSKPQVKIKGLGGSSLSLMDRMKQFKKKDLAFIAAGLGVLFMAPLAEHFMMSPETAESGAFKEGWGFRDAAGEFGKGSSPYEGGYNGLAPGSLLGQDADVITPLNVRDPSALVMGPGSKRAKPVSTAKPPAPAKASATPDWKDALAAAASKAGKKAKKAASIPVPKIPLKGGLRGLGATSGGGGGSYTLPKLSAANVPNRPGASSRLSRVRPASGFKGAASPRGRNNTSGGIEDLKKAAARASAAFNRGGSAGSNLQTAANASRGIPTGSGAGGKGAGGAGEADKATSASQDVGGKSQGESLEFMLAKSRAEKELDLEFKKKEKDEMFWPDLKRDMQKELIMTPLKGLTGGIKDLITKGIKGIGDAASGPEATYVCDKTATGGGHMDPIPISAAPPCGSASEDSTKEGGIKCFDGTHIRWGNSATDGTVWGYNCDSHNGETPVTPDPGAEGDQPSELPIPDPTTLPGESGKTMAQICSDVNALDKVEKRSEIDMEAVKTELKKMGKGLIEARDAMSGPTTTGCGATALVASSPNGVEPNIEAFHQAISDKMTEAVRVMNETTQSCKDAVHDARMSIHNTATGKISPKAEAAATCTADNCYGNEKAQVLEGIAALPGFKKKAGDNQKACANLYKPLATAGENNPLDGANKIITEMSAPALQKVAGALTDAEAGKTALASNMALLKTADADNPANAWYAELKANETTLRERYDKQLATQEAWVKSHTDGVSASGDVNGLIQDTVARVGEMGVYNGHVDDPSGAGIYGYPFPAVDRVPLQSDFKDYASPLTPADALVVGRHAYDSSTDAGSMIKIDELDHRGSVDGLMDAKGRFDSDTEVIEGVLQGTETDAGNLKTRTIDKVMPAAAGTT